MTSDQSPDEFWPTASTFPGGWPRSADRPQTVADLL